MTTTTESVSTATEHPAPSADDLSQRYRLVRQASEELIEPLSPEDCQVQSMPDASPAKWHLAHTTWFFETFILEREVENYTHFHHDFRVLYNSYYNSVGEQYPRPKRGLVSRPSLQRVIDYRRQVDERMLRLLENNSGKRSALRPILEIGLNHEQQHQELLLTDIKHLFSCNPLYPCYRELAEPDIPPTQPLDWFAFQEGIRWIGHSGEGFAFDNEAPRHRAFVEAFQMASRPATNGEYLEFMDDGGYRRPELWLSEGWATVLDQGWAGPFYWRRVGDDWHELKLSGLKPLRLESPVCHLSYFEADAFARWSGARLPSEQEWETAGGQAPFEGNFVESGLLHPSPQAKRTEGHPAQLFGDLWEWTRSAYTVYPGYQAPKGALGEYNAKFTSGQLVLRGGSCATPRSHFRPTYRNFFPPGARWQFSGVRLAKDAA